MKKVLYTAWVLLISIDLCAQLVVSSGTMTPTQYVQNVLLGSGVTVSNVTFQGNVSQIGEFNSANANVGITSGLILATGDVNVAVGPNDDSGASLPLGGINGPGDPDLDMIVGSSIGTNDAAVLEFDFVPQSDTIKFNYVFASEEYLEYVNAGFNDAFGFFLSGPGISGPYSNGAVNIALLPNGTPVTIDNVNTTLNSSYYIDNGDGFTAPYNTDNQYIQFDGKTVKLTAAYPVQCGQTYHIKLAIADAMDGAYDSGVFLEENSFTSANPQVSAVPITTGVGNDSTLVEGCGGLTLIFERFENLNQDYTIHYFLSGTADTLTDVTGIPDSVTIPAGSQEQIITVTANYDNLNEGTEELNINITSLNVCSGQIDTTVYTFYVEDPKDISVTAVDDTLGCFDNTALVYLSDVSGGYSPYSYLWSNGQTTAAFNISVSNTIHFIVTVTDICGLKYATDTAIIYVPKDTIVAFPMSYNVVCPRDTVVVYPDISGGHPPYYLVWESGNSGINYADTLTPQNSQVVYVSITDECKKDTVISYVKIEVPQYPPLQLFLNQDTVHFDCPGETVAANPSAAGGSPPYSFTWTNWQTLEDSVVFTATQAQELQVQVTDFCHTDTLSKTFYIDIPDYSHFTIVSEYDSMLCYGDSSTIVITPKGGAGEYTILWSDFLGTSDSVTVYPKDEHKTYSVTVTDKCGNTASDEFSFSFTQPVADFQWDYYSDRNRVWFYSQSYGVGIKEIWNFGDGSIATGDTVPHRFEILDNFFVQLKVIDQNGCKDSIIKEYIPPAAIYFPNAFTPDEDGFNEVFKPQGENIIDYKITIYDRWGQVVFSSSDINEGWNGSYLNKGKKKLPEGVYTYQYEYKMPAKTEVFKGAGTVVLIK